MNTRKIYLALLATAVLSLAACSREIIPEEHKGPEIVLAANQRHVVTRAGEDVSYFQDGSKYSLFFMHYGETDWSSGSGHVRLYDGEGTEDASGHSISYSTLSYNNLDEAINVYGLSYDNGTKPTVSAQASTAPTITLSAIANQQIPDLLHSNNVTGHKASDGNIEMRFEHALSRLTFEVVKMDESGLAADHRRLTALKLKSIKLKSRQAVAAMDVTTGVWTADGTVNDYQCFSSVDGVAVGLEPGNPATPGTMANALANSSAIIFPINTTVGSNKITLEVTFADFGLASNQEITSTYEITGVNFVRNTSYKVSIMAMQDGSLTIVTVKPQVYDWVNEWVNPEQAVVGQPVVIGGVVWMDRNVGATSADCEHDFMHTLGAQFCYGRSIPYYLDLEMMSQPENFDDFYTLDETSGKYSFNYGKVRVTTTIPSISSSTGIADSGTYASYHKSWYKNSVYALDPDGNKVSTVAQTNLYNLMQQPLFSGKKATQVVAIAPGDEGDYSFISDSNGKWYDGNSSEPSLGFDDTTLGEGTKYFQTQWKDHTTQPAPKGWRLPTVKEAYTLFPEEDIAAGWAYRYGIYSVGADFVDKDTPSTAKSTNESAQGLKLIDDPYYYQYIHGFWRVKDGAVADENGLYEIEESVTDEGDNVYVAYGIKHQGTNQAYRIKIEQRPSNISNGKYVRFSIFPATQDDYLCLSATSTAKEVYSVGSAAHASHKEAARSARWNLNKFDWDHPSAVIDFPLAGRLGTPFSNPALSQFGIAVRSVVNTSDYEPPTLTNGYYYSAKLSESSGIGMSSTYHCTAGTIRLVRDFDVD